MKTNRLFSKVGIAVAVLAFFTLSTGCNVAKNSETGDAKYRAGYHASNDSLPECVDADSVCDPPELGFNPVLPPGQTELTNRQLNKQFRHYKKERRRDRADKRTQARRDFVLDKKQIKQRGKTERVEVKQDGKTNRVEAKQTGRTDRVEVRRKNGIFSGIFSPSILLLIFLVMFVILIFIYRRKIFKL